MRHLLRALLLSSLALTPGAAQDTIKAEPTDLTIKSYTKLVQVPVIVRDKSGKPVKGLTKGDFVLYEDGKVVKIASFQSSTPLQAQAMAAASERQLPAGEYTNAVEGKPVERPVVILLIDAMNTDFLDQAQARRAMIKFLSERVEPGTLLSLMIMSRSGVRVIHEYSTDPEILIAALKKVNVASAAGGTNEEAARIAAAQTISPNDLTGKEEAMLTNFITGGAEFAAIRRAAYTSQSLFALNSIGAMFANVPGRKALIWIASSFPYFGDDFTSISSTDPRGKFIQAFDKLNDANVALYPVDARGLLGYDPPSMNAAVPSSGMVARNPGRTSSAGSNQVLNGFGDTQLGFLSASHPIDNMKVVAELTGGLPFYGTNDLSGAIKKATDDAEDYYMLGYYLQGGQSAKVEQHKLKVVVIRKDVTVRSRSKLVWIPEASSPKNEIWTALRTPLEYTGIPLKVKFDRTKAAGPEVPFEIQVNPQMLELAEPGNSLSLNVVVEARAASGAVVDRVDQTLTGKINRADEFRVKPLLYASKLQHLENAATVHFLVRDNNSGKIGSVIVETKQ